MRKVITLLRLANISLRLCIALTVTLFAINTSAHSQCSKNDEFAIMPDPDGTYCPTFLAYPTSYWKRSHGTPEIILVPPPPPGPTNQAYMFATFNSAQNRVEGEGIFQNFNLKRGRQYRLTLKAAVSGSPGTTFVYATNGLVESPLGCSGCCGHPLPNPTKELIKSYSDLTTSFTEREYSFSPKNDFAQFWIYPSTNSTTQTNLSVDRLLICDVTCTSHVVFSEIVPDGLTIAATVVIQSLPGLTTVASSTSSTDIRASQEIFLLPDFSAAMSGSAEFSARIEACDDGSSGSSFSSPAEDQIQNLSRKSNGNAILFNQNNLTDSSKILSDQRSITLFPNPARGEVTISHTKTRDGVINVYNAQGILLITAHIKPNSSRTRIEAKDIPSGIYIVKVIDKMSGATETRTFLKQ